MKILKKIFLIISNLLNLSLKPENKTTMPDNKTQKVETEKVLMATNQYPPEHNIIKEENQAKAESSIQSFSTVERYNEKDLTSAKNCSNIYFFRKANNDGIFLKEYSKMETRSWFKVVFNNENLTEGEYCVIEDKILNGIMPNDYKSCIQIDDTLYNQNNTLETCTTEQKGIVEKTEQGWRIKQILKIKIQ